jgi:hypothetical protein
MNDAKLTKLLEALSNLAYDVKGQFLIDFSCHAISLEISSRTILHNQVNIILRVDDFIELDDIRVFKLLHDGDLVV